VPPYAANHTGIADGFSVPMVVRFNAVHEVECIALVVARLLNDFGNIEERVVVFLKRANDAVELTHMCSQWAQPLRIARRLTGQSDKLLVCHRASKLRSRWQSAPVSPAPGLDRKAANTGFVDF
jgi:hypothetical protein|tara:strand:- start:739 stop:1110 length:372 start_codon:yes stop_codon:yes gene_type:complete